MMTALQVGLSVPILEAQSGTESSEGSGPKSQGWHGLDLKPDCFPAKEGNLARDGEAMGVREVLAVEWRGRGR